MSVQAVLTADNHLDLNVVSFGPKMFQRRQDFLRSFAEVVEHAKKEHADLLLVGGDLFDSIRPSNSTRTAVMDMLKSLYDRGTKTFLVSGHHDTPKSVEEGASPLAIYGSSGYAHFFQNPLKPEAIELDLGGTQIHLIGISHNPLLGAGDDPLSNMALRPIGDFNIILTHYPIEGLGGWIGQEPSIRSSEIPKGFQLLVSGHFHGYQSKMFHGTDAIYPGSTERVSFGEEEEDKGFVWVEFDKTGVKAKEFVKTSARPFRTLRREFHKDFLDKIKAELESISNPEVVLRLRLYGTATIADLSTYRRSQVLSLCQGKFFHSSVEDGELIIHGPKTPETLRRTTPLQELQRQFQQLIENSDPQERYVLEESLHLCESRLQEAGAW